LGDPRSALEELYPSFEQDREWFVGAARELVRRRYVLDEDLPRLLEFAERQW
jgi:hypothetical protein